MFKLLGSLQFAIALIATTLIFVIAGTFLESISSSHLFAAHFTYENPIFQLLLWLYFINILFSALSRFPFQKKHIPFLLTHLGLLLILLGVFVKNHFGVQGALALTEGSSSHAIFLPKSYALHIESPKKVSLIEIKNGALGAIDSNFDELNLTILEWTPHAEERLEGFIKGKWGHLLNLPPFEVKDEGSSCSLSTPEYQIYAYRTDRAIAFPGHASLFFIQDSAEHEHLVAFNHKGERFDQELKSETFYIYNKGYGGYATFANLPAHFPRMDLIAPLTRKWIAQELSKKKEEAKPLIRLLASSSEKCEIVTLSYDQYAEKFKWPILGGKYLMRFQSMKKEIPFPIRLIEARQVNYPETNQPYSYEAKISIGNEKTTLSMNHVFEKKGYRFYLANLISSTFKASRVQIIVNYDPAKYFLTYPGAILLALGITLLYLQKRYV